MSDDHASLAGKVAVVTGAGRGLGQFVACGLAARRRVVVVRALLRRFTRRST